MGAFPADQVIQELSRKLATRSRHVCVLLGAGASTTCGLPTMADLERSIMEELTEDDRAIFMSFQRKGLNLENILSRLRRIVSLLDGDVDQKVDDLTAKNAKELDLRICSHIVENLKIDDKDLLPMEDFARWASRADYHLPVEVFTTNYDLALETAFERLKVPYFDGYVGVMNAGFRTDLVEASDKDDNWLPRFLVRLWKLHGSIHWKWGDEKRASVVRLGTAVNRSIAAIYPSDAKYEESRRVPFVVLQDRFRRALHQSETLVLISGYSFKDDHLNEIIFEAAQQCQRSEFWAFCYTEIPEVLIKKAQGIPNLQAIGESKAIIGGNEGSWECSSDGSRQDLQDNDKQDIALGNFAVLAKYLANGISYDGERKLYSDRLGSNG